MYVLKSATLLAMLTELIDTGNTLDGVKLGLYTADKFPSKGMLIADFTHAAIGGSADLQAVVWGDAFVNDNGQAEVLGAMLTWTTVTAPSPEVTAYGWIMTDNAGTGLLMAERFAIPYTFNRAGQSLAIVPRVVQDA